jgi:hypothetical protein
MCHWHFDYCVPRCFVEGPQVAVQARIAFQVHPACRTVVVEVRLRVRLEGPFLAWDPPKVRDDGFASNSVSTLPLCAPHPVVSGVQYPRRMVTLGVDSKRPWTGQPLQGLPRAQAGYGRPGRGVAADLRWCLVPASARGAVRGVGMVPRALTWGPHNNFPERSFSGREFFEERRIFLGAGVR